MKYLRLGDLLVQAGTITEDELMQALALQKGSGERLGTVLIQSGIITERELIQALEVQLGVEFIDLSKTTLSPEIARLLPKGIAQRNSVVPVSSILP